MFYFNKTNLSLLHLVRDGAEWLGFRAVCGLSGKLAGMLYLATL